MDDGNILLAKQLSRHFHKGQKYGEHDYFDYHILGVLKTLYRVSKEHPTEEMVIIALLHDVLEDTECSEETIENTFGENILKSVAILTKTKFLSPDDYIERIIRHKTPRLVKYADSLFNYNECIKDGNHKRAKKYKYNLDVLYSEELVKELVKNES